MRALLGFVPFLLLAGDAPYRQQIESWRAARETALKADDGWLTVAGLFWLKDGVNKAGANPSLPVALPTGAAPAYIGAFHLAAAKVTFEPDPNAGVTINGKPATRAVLQDDHAPKPDLVAVRDLVLFVIKRGDRYAIRMRDKNNPARREFAGLRWYPVKPEWNKPAKFIRYPSPRKYTVNTSIGTRQEAEAVGYALFPHAGREVKLEASIDEGQLFFVFRDRTAGKTTYPAARFVKVDIPKGENIQLDFNKAYNPPCVFTPFATCPLPIAQNRLPFEIPAGEMMYRGRH